MWVTLWMLKLSKYVYEVQAFEFLIYDLEVKLCLELLHRFANPVHEMVVG